jgi:hypothetical protein
LIQIPLDEIYYNNHFVLDGKAHKCHPDLSPTNVEGKDQKGISANEQRRIKEMLERERIEKRNGWSSPLYT